MAWLLAICAAPGGWAFYALFQQIAELKKQIDNLPKHQKALCPQDCILEYGDLLHDEWRTKKYLQEKTSGWGLHAMFTDLEPWQGTSNIDFSWLDEDLPDNWKYRRKIDKLKNSLAELVSTTRNIKDVKVQLEIDEMLRIFRNKSTP